MDDQRLWMPIVPRQTKQKKAIRESFTKADRPLSPEEVLGLAQRNVPGVSIATIYRNIAALTDEGWLTPVAIPGTSARYEIAGKQHHHHFQCKDCEKVFELSGCDVDINPQLPKGFRVTGHEFFLYGVCAECR